MHVTEELADPVIVPPMKSLLLLLDMWRRRERDMAAAGATASARLRPSARRAPMSAIATALPLSNEGVTGP